MKPFTPAEIEAITPIIARFEAQGRAWAAIRCIDCGAAAVAPSTQATRCGPCDQRAYRLQEIKDYRRGTR